MSNPQEDEQEDVIVVNYCVLCSHPTNIQLSGGTCRVCGQVYHRSCIDGSYKYTSDDLEMFDRTNTATGWSCSDCVSHHSFMHWALESRLIKIVVGNAIYKLKKFVHRYILVP